MDWIPIISAISAIVALSGAIITYYLVLEQKRISKFQTSYSMIIEVEKMLYDNKELLRLHNITDEDLKACNLTHKELTYILLSFDSAQVYHLIGNSRKTDISQYRQNFLDNEKVKTAWHKIIRPKMIKTSTFTKYVDHYYKSLANNP